MSEPNWKDIMKYDGRKPEPPYDPASPVTHNPAEETPVSEKPVNGVIQKWNDPKWRSWAKLYATDEYRITELTVALTTEQTMHAAWRKRAEEAEAKLAPPPPSDAVAEPAHPSTLCPDCGHEVEKHNSGGRNYNGGCIAFVDGKICPCTQTPASIRDKAVRVEAGKPGNCPACGASWGSDHEQGCSIQAKHLAMATAQPGGVSEQARACATDLMAEGHLIGQENDPENTYAIHEAAAVIARHIDAALTAERAAHDRTREELEATREVVAGQLVRVAELENQVRNLKPYN